MVSWIDCWCFREYNRIFQKSTIFWCSGGIFGIAKIGVFHGFQSSVSISTLIREQKMLAPSFRSLSKALIPELSIEPSTKGLAILVPKLSQFWRYESATFSVHESPKCPNLRPSGDHFPWKKWYVPPPIFSSQKHFFWGLSKFLGRYLSEITTASLVAQIWNLRLRGCILKTRPKYRNRGELSCLVIS